MALTDVKPSKEQQHIAYEIASWVKILFKTTSYQLQSLKICVKAAVAPDVIFLVACYRHHRQHECIFSIFVYLHLYLSNFPLQMANSPSQPHIYTTSHRTVRIIAIFLVVVERPLLRNEITIVIAVVRVIVGGVKAVREAGY